MYILHIHIFICIDKNLSKQANKQLQQFRKIDKTPVKKKIPCEKQFTKIATGNRHKINVTWMRKFKLGYGPFVTLVVIFRTFATCCCSNFIISMVCFLFITVVVQFFKCFCANFQPKIVYSQKVRVIKFLAHSHTHAGV